MLRWCPTATLARTSTRTKFVRRLCFVPSTEGFDMTLYIFRGLPGCGKSTRAQEMQSANGGVIAERDRIRFALFGRYHDVDEDQVTKVQTNIVNEALRRGEHVYVSDMNLRNQYVTRFIKMANEHNEKWEIIDMTNVDLLSVLMRNDSEERQRAGKVVPME